MSIFQADRMTTLKIDAIYIKNLIYVNSSLTWTQLMHYRYSNIGTWASGRTCVYLRVHISLKNNAICYQGVRFRNQSKPNTPQSMQTVKYTCLLNFIQTHWINGTNLDWPKCFFYVHYDVRKSLKSALVSFYVIYTRKTMGCIVYHGKD